MAPLLLLLLLAGDPPADTPLETAADLQEPAEPAGEVRDPPPPASEPPAQAAPPPAKEEAKPSEPPKPPPVGPPPPHTGVKATLKAIPGDFTHLPTGMN